MTIFSVDFYSDSKYVEMTAEISFDGQILCQINQDKGIHSMEIEFFHDQRVLDKNPQMKFDLNKLLEIIERTKSELSKIRD